MSSDYDEFGLKLLREFKQCEDRDGSQAFDSLTSIHQYFPLYKLTNKYLLQGVNVLDWGAGSGHFTFFLINSGYKTTSYSFNYPGLLEGKESQLNLKFILGNVRQPTVIPVLDNDFDAIYSVGVLEHVREFGGTEEASISEIHRALKVGGLFFCYHFPNKLSWIEFLARILKVWSHQYLYSKADINKLFSEEKWEIVELKRYAVLPRNILGKIPLNCLKESRLAALFFDGLDNLLTYPFRFFAQNWVIVVRKKANSLNND